MKGFGTKGGKELALLGIDHMAILVSDLEASIENWREKFGLSLNRRSEHPGIGIKQAYMKFPNGGFLELVAPLDENSPMHQSLSDLGEGFRGLTLEVDNIEETLAELQRKGVRTFEQGGVVFIHSKSANGLVISLTQTD